MYSYVQRERLSDWSSTSRLLITVFSDLKDTKEREKERVVGRSPVRSGPDSVEKASSQAKELIHRIL